MLGSVIEKLQHIFWQCRGSSVRLGQPSSHCTKVVVHVPLGAVSRRPPVAQARLTKAESLEEIRAVVRFSASQRLPVSAWLITGVWQVPARADRLARWVCEVANEAGEASVWVDDCGMPARFRRRFEGHLRRCQG